jgi:hypothetical protein
VLNRFSFSDSVFVDIGHSIKKTEMAARETSRCQRCLEPAFNLVGARSGRDLTLPLR